MLVPCAALELMVAAVASALAEATGKEGGAKGERRGGAEARRVSAEEDVTAAAWWIDPLRVFHLDPLK